MLLEYKERLSEGAQKMVEELAQISKWLRKEREFALYGEIDFIPTLVVYQEDGERTRKDARFVVSIAEQVIR